MNDMRHKPNWRRLRHLAARLATFAVIARKAGSATIAFGVPLT
jgi:hypothetical protein